MLFATAPPPTANFQIQCHEGSEELRALSAPLRASGLLPAPLPEMDPDYLAEGLDGGRAGAMVARRDGRAVAYLPYVMRRARFSLKLGSIALGWLPFRQLVIFGYAGNDDDRDAVIERMLAALLERRGWDVAHLFESPIDAPLAEHLARIGIRSARGLRTSIDTYETLQVDLAPTFADYLATRFTKKTRYNLKREVRLLETAFSEEVVMRVFRSPEEAEPFLRDAERIARRTYQWRLRLNTARANPILIGRTRLFAAQGNWRGYILYLRQEPVAYCYATVRFGELSYDIVGYDPTFVKHNPGKVLLFKILEDLHQEHSVPRLSFGKGITGYKELFATSRRLALDASIHSERAYPALLRSLSRATELTYQWLRPRVRHWMPAIKRLARGGTG